jgi:hypothetical protein
LPEVIGEAGINMRKVEQRQFLGWNYSEWDYEDDTCLTHLSKSTECITLTVVLNVNYVLFCQMYHSVENVASGRGCACVGLGTIWEISVLSIQSCCEPKKLL